MNKSAKRKDRRKAARGQLWLHLPGMVREALYDTVIGAGLACVEEVLETERVALCGERYEHLVSCPAISLHNSCLNLGHLFRLRRDAHANWKAQGGTGVEPTRGGPVV